MMPLLNSQRYRLTAVFFILVTILLTLFQWSLTSTVKSGHERRMMEREELYIQLISEISHRSLLVQEYDAAQLLAEELLRNPYIEKIILADYRNRIVVSTDFADIGRPFEAEKLTAPSWRYQAITNPAGTQGTLAVSFLRTETAEVVKEMKQTAFLMAIPLILIVAGVSFLLSFMLSRRLERLETVAREVAAGNMEIRASEKGTDEIAKLASTFNTMTSEIDSSIKALRHSKEEWVKTFDAINDIIIIQDKDMRIIRANKAAHDALQVEPGELNSKYCYEVFREANHPCENCPELETFSDKHTHSTNITHKQLGKHFHVTCSPIFDANDEFTQIVLVARDITDRLKLEAQLNQAQKMEAIGTLAGGIAHDFNNILGAIIGYTEMARDDSLEKSSVVEDLDNVLEASARAVGLVKQILSFSRQDETENVLLQPASIVSKAIAMLRPTLPTTIEITQDIDTKTGLIFGDPTQIHQILMNLCTNAFHAMEKTGGRLDISLKEIDLRDGDHSHEPDVKAGTFIQLSVGDSGAGMTQEVKDKIFDPYFTTKEVGKGTGMGLSIVHGIIKSYGGFITLSSELGKGTAFHVFLPVVNKEVLPAKEAIEQVPIGKEKILFIDDEDVLADMGKTMLERLGYHVTVRKSSLEALETFQNQPDQFDVVITDQTMPGMTGVDLARRMLQIRPDIPIILCTGYSSTISEEKAKSFGIREFAFKPVGKRDIAMLIRKVLDGNQVSNMNSTTIS